MPCIRTCEFNKTDKNEPIGEVMSKNWEIWDLRILALYILASQLYLHFFGRHRTKSKSAAIMIGSVSLLYLLSDLLATIALGKLSKLNVNKNPGNTTDSSNITMANTTDGFNTTMADILKSSMGNATIGKGMLRVMWAPLILFYLGGPDTITVLNLQENQMWMKHLIGLFTQGFRAVYALIATWSFSQKKPWSIQGLISLLALLILIPGLIKYGERVWIIKSRNKYYGGFVRLHPSEVNVSKLRPNAKRVVLSYFCIQTLMPHCPDYPCNGKRVRDLVSNFKSVREDNAFKLIEIELGLIYDMIFSKIGMIFTIWGSILRFLSLSMIVSGLVVFLKSDKPPPGPGHLLEGDDVITIILIAGAIFLEIAGIVVQLFSDWAVVWACHIDRIKWATPLLFFHEVLLSERQRWPGVMGQLSLLDFFKKYDPNACTRCLKNCIVNCLGNTAGEYLFGMDKELKRYKTLKSLVPDVEKLIIRYLRKKNDPSPTSTQKIAEVDNSQISTEEIGGSDNIVGPTSHEKVADDGKLPGVTRGEWTLEKYDKQLKWSIELQFDRSIVIWHIATEVCYGLDHGRDSANRKVVKMLSDYMMYLLIECSTSFPFCNKYDKIGKDYDRLKKLFIREGLVPSRQKRVENEGDTPYIADEAQKLVLHMKEHPERWAILESIWAEMLCYAAWRCRVKYHIEELRHGGEFLTRVWLLQMHSCDKMPRRSSSSLRSVLDESAKTTGNSCFSCLDMNGND